DETNSTLQPHTSSPATPSRSLYLPPNSESCSESSSSGNMITQEQKDSKTHSALNQYLHSRDVSLIRSRMSMPWNDANERTKRYYNRKTGQAVRAVVSDIAPNDALQLFEVVCSSSKMAGNYPTYEDLSGCHGLNETLMMALVECYNAADCWETRRQILSIMAEKMPLKRLQHWIPNITKYMFTEAKRHCLIQGRGAPVQNITTSRLRVSTSQIDHFIDFITSSHITQDLPSGEKIITLSTKETIKVPNVIRTMVRAQIATQYINYCEQLGFKPLSHSSLLLILNVCAASSRKSLQGLDYISSAGAEAFDDLCGVAETLGDVGQGMGQRKAEATTRRQALP
ncbi:Hypothetical predicted protein, partial [Paramuricea clavata]